MKKGLILTVLFCIASLNGALFAQQNNERRRVDFEKFKAQREEFITKAMALTEDEAKVFWPICNELQAKKFELNRSLREEIRKIRQAKRDGKTVNEADYKKVVELSASVKVKEAQLEEEYVAKFLKVLPGEKVFSYQRAEQQFANEMFGRNERRGGERRGNNNQQ
jgi:hypothetical protein